MSAASFSLTAPAIDVDMRMFLQRDARLLVLVSCEPGAPGASVGTDSGTSSCASQRQLFLQQYLGQLGIEHTVVLTAADFMNELRCGRYNTYWLSGGSEKLPEADADELRETIYRGEGLLLDGSHDQRTSHLDEIAGYRYRGHLPDPDQWLRGTGSLIPEVDVATYGRALRLEGGTGVVLAGFPDGTPAIISNGYGQGRALIWAFDLVEVLQRDAMLPASAALFDLALLHVAPTTLAGVNAPDAVAVNNIASWDERSGEWGGIGQRDHRPGGQCTECARQPTGCGRRVSPRRRPVLAGSGPLPHWRRAIHGRLRIASAAAPGKRSVSTLARLASFGGRAVGKLITGTKVVDEYGKPPGWSKLVGRTPGCWW